MSRLDSTTLKSLSPLRSTAVTTCTTLTCSLSFLEKSVLLFRGALNKFLSPLLLIDNSNSSHSTTPESVSGTKLLRDESILWRQSKLVCIQISTSAALRLMLLPGILAISTPVIIGFGFGDDGAQVLASVMAGVAVTGVLMAIFQSNAGGAWDNAKKSFEKGVEINGQMYYKGSEPHKAAVTGDTVGDPFKDTSGPSMNILIKLTAIVSLVIAPMLQKPTPHTTPMAPQSEISAPVNNDVVNSSATPIIK